MLEDAEAMGAVQADQVEARGFDRQHGVRPERQAAGVVHRVVRVHVVETETRIAHLRGEEVDHLAVDIDAGVGTDRQVVGEEGLHELGAATHVEHAQPAEVGDAEQPPDGAFDVVQAGLVLFFLPSLDTALARYREVLTADGRLGFTWFGQPDARWGPVFGALAADLPEHERPNRAAEDGPFGSVPAMHEHLTALGWTDVTTEKLVLEVQVRDADHWFEWSWSQGYRTVLEKLESRDLLAAARERVRRLLEEMAARDGALTWRAEVQATLAHPS